MIGAGWWASHVYIPALLDHPDVDLVAVNRPDTEGLEAVKERFGIASAYTDHREMLRQERPDAVVIASPHIVHFTHARDALNAGAHVLVDKPMTTDADEARELVALAERVGRQIIVPYGWNFKDFTRRAMDLVAAGEIGQIRHAICQMASPTADLFAGEGLVETEDHMFRPARSTWADPEKAGGYGWGQLSHALGLYFAIVDRAPIEVFAIGGRSSAGVDYYDAATVQLEGGTTLALSGAATVPKHRGYQLDIRVFGSEGMLLLDIERERMEVRRHDRRDTVVDVPSGAGAYQCVEPIARLADVCLGRAERIEAPGRVGMRAVEVLDAMYRSLASGRPEPV